jgi:phosphoglycerate dehydrogenase-like enzyme
MSRRWALRLFQSGDVAGKTLGIIGQGLFGKAVAERARGFRMRILYCNLKLWMRRKSRDWASRTVVSESCFANPTSFPSMSP